MKCPKCNHVFTIKKVKPARKRCVYCNEFIEKREGVKIYNCGVSPAITEHWHKACREKINYCYKCKTRRDKVTIEEGYSYGICEDCKSKEDNV